jgi:hypothetical protein
MSAFDHALQELIDWLDAPPYSPYWCKFSQVCQKYLLDDEASIKLGAQFSECYEARRLTDEFTSYFDAEQTPQSTPF